MKKKTILISVLAATLVMTLSCNQEQPANETSTAPKPMAAKAAVSVGGNAWQVPVDVTAVPPPNPSEANYIDFGWQSFVALSWPSLSPASGGVNGQPDTGSMIGATAANGAF